MSVDIEEVRKAADDLLKTSQEFPGEYHYDATWEVLERDGCELGGMCCIHEEASHIASCCNLAPKLAEFVLQELARRDAEAAERALPITEEWFLSIGDTSFPSKLDGGSVEHWGDGLVAIIESGDRSRAVSTTISTRGQLLDLLAALKGDSP